jgi:hypothetical protein
MKKISEPVYFLLSNSLSVSFFRVNHTKILIIDAKIKKT